MASNRLMILVEVQSTWTVNIIIRALMYMVQTYHDYFERTKQNLYKSKKVQMPVPEIYVIYTGARKEKPLEISLSQEFFEGNGNCLGVKVKMIYEGSVSGETGEGDIINQYILFAKVCSEQIAHYGRTKKAILETIRICKNRNVLKDYLEKKEKEVVDIMMVLYDEQEVMRSYVESEKHDADIETARRFWQMGKLTYQEIADGTGLTIQEIQKLADVM